MLHDPWVRVYLLAVGLFSLPYFFSHLLPEQIKWQSYRAEDLILFPVIVLCLQNRLGELPSKTERTFWNFFTLALGSWWVLEVLQILAPGVAKTFWADMFVAGFYFFLLAAADTKPHARAAEYEAGWGSALAGYGASLLTVGLLVYFVLVPSRLTSGFSWTLLPSVSFALVMDVFLVIRFGYLWRTCRTGRWRALYGLALAAMVFWLATDFLDVLIVSNAVPWQAGSPPDLLWILADVPLVFAARLRHFPWPLAEEDPAEKIAWGPDARLIRSRNFLVVYAVAFPALHFVLYAFDILTPVLRDAREMVVLVCVLSLGTLALLDRFLLERGSRAALAERRRAEEALQTSERRYRALVESGQGLICTHDMNGVFLSVNPAAARLLGYEPGEMVGKHVAEFLSPWSLERVDEYFGYLKRDGVDEGLIRARARDGSEQVWVYQSTLFEQPGAEPIVLGHAQDITGRVRAEEALRESESRNRALLDAIPDMMFILGRDGVIHDFKASREVEPILPPEKLLGRELSEVLPQELAERTLPYIAHALASGEVFVYEYDLPSPGDRVHFEGRLVALGEDKVMAMVRDITDRKRAEAALQRSEAALEEAQRIAHIGSWDWDLTRNTVVRSPELRRLFRMPPQRTSSPEAFLAAVHPEDLPRVKVALSACLERGQHYDVVYRLRYADGAVRDVHARGEVLRNEQGEAVRMIGTAQDITEERAVARFKDEIISIVSHELRTPLTAVRGSLGLLSAGILGAVSKQAKRMLEVATNNTDRLVRLLNDILDLERLKSGKTELARSRWEVAEVLEEVGQIMTPDAERAGVVLEIVPDQVCAFADRDRIVQVLTNLLSNAIKFSPPEGRVWLRVRRNGTELLFQVEDQGRGIPEDKVDAIFGRFEQVDTSDARERGGAGLGLAICRSIVEQHGGRIWATSRLHEGSVFSFTVPAETESG